MPVTAFTVKVSAREYRGWVTVWENGQFIRAYVLDATWPTRAEAQEDADRRRRHIIETYGTKL